jgi:hypothetical protein
MPSAAGVAHAAAASCLLDLHEGIRQLAAM